MDGLAKSLKLCCSINKNASDKITPGFRFPPETCVPSATPSSVPRRHRRPCLGGIVVRTSAASSSVSRKSLPKSEVALSRRELSAVELVAQAFRSLFRTCAAFGVVLGSTPARTSRQNLGDPNDLENSDDCRSAGGHGNQHVRLRSAQINRRRSARLVQRSAASSRAGVLFCGFRISA
jgi:hypothetical protein